MPIDTCYVISVYMYIHYNNHLFTSIPVMYVLSTLLPGISIYTPTSRYLSLCILIYSTITDFKYHHAFICQQIYGHLSPFMCIYSMITV